MPVTPTGPLSGPLEHARTLLANCPTWQAWTATANPSAAAAKVHLVGQEAPSGGWTKANLQAARPWAIIDLDPGTEAFKATAFNRHRSGRILVGFEREIPAEYASSYPDAQIDFQNGLGAIVQEMFGLVTGDGAYLRVKNITLVEGPTMLDDDAIETLGNYLSSVLALDWGTP